MRLYVEPLPTADLILQLYLSTGRHRLELSEMTSHIDTSRPIRTAIRQMQEDLFIVKDDGTRECYMLISKGAQIAHSGGYKSLIEEENKIQERQLHIEAMNLAMIESVTETNNAMVRNITITKRLTYLAIAIALVSAIGQLGDFFINILRIKEPTNQKLKTLQTTPKSDSIGSSDTIRKNVARIDTPINGNKNKKTK